jgi:hypothetical protein
VPDAARPLACRTLNASLEALLAEVAQCQTDAEFLAQLGFLLNAQGRYTEALDHLERALMLNPGLKGAQIDYAVALAGIGDYASALTLVQDLLADPALPSGLVPVLQRQIENLSVSMNTGTATTDKPLRVRGTAGVQVGYATNPLGSPNLSSLILTFPGLPVELPLDGSYLARPGSYGRADASLSMRYDAGADVLYDFFGGVQGFRSVLAESSRSQQAEFAVERMAGSNSLGQRIFAGGVLSRPVGPRAPYGGGRPLPVADPDRGRRAARFDRLAVVFLRSCTELPEPRGIRSIQPRIEQQPTALGPLWWRQRSVAMLSGARRILATRGGGGA